MSIEVKTGDGPITLLGYLVDKHTRCKHYDSNLDIIALKFKCCNNFYPCYKCHLESVHHEIVRWRPADLIQQRVILCGSCYNLLSYNEYSECDSKCMYCRAPFNPKCLLHKDLYFDI